MGAGAGDREGRYDVLTLAVQLGGYLGARNQRGSGERFPRRCKGRDDRVNRGIKLFHEGSLGIAISTRIGALADLKIIIIPKAN